MFVGVHEFSAEAGTVLLPEAVMRALGVRLEDAGEKVVVRYYPAPKVRCRTPTRGAGVCATPPHRTMSLNGIVVQRDRERLGQRPQ